MSSLQKSITIFVYGGCNLDCIYCYSAQKLSNKSIDINFAESGIRQFFGNTGSNQLRLFGVGEPTIAFNQMAEIVKYAKLVVGPSLEVELQSNGCFSETVADWIERNVHVLWLSCDGPPDIQDAYRPTIDGFPSSGIVIKNIVRFASSEFCQLGVRATITSETSARQIEIVEYFYSLGVRYICADPIFLPVRYDKDKATVPEELLLRDPVLYAKDFLRAHDRACELGISFDSILTVNAGLRNRFGCRGCYTNPHLTVDGAVTCCDMAFSADTPLKEMIWGKYDAAANKITYNKRAINRVMSRCVENLQLCSKCKWKYECSGGCFGEALNEFKDVLSVKNFSCEATKYILPRLDRLPPSPLGHP